eukprot:COSAG05_NODE_17122_length_331_cov_1.112069_1_plen_33_part_10
MLVWNAVCKFVGTERTSELRFLRPLLEKWCIPR